MELLVTEDSSSFPEPIEEEDEEEEEVPVAVAAALIILSMAACMALLVAGGRSRVALSRVTRDTSAAARRAVRSCSPACLTAADLSWRVITSGEAISFQSPLRESMCSRNHSRISCLPTGLASTSMTAGSNEDIMLLLAFATDSVVAAVDEISGCSWAVTAWCSATMVASRMAFLLSPRPSIMMGAITRSTFTPDDSASREATMCPIADTAKGFKLAWVSLMRGFSALRISLVALLASRKWLDRSQHDTMDSRAAFRRCQLVLPSTKPSSVTMFLSNIADRS